MALSNLLVFYLLFRLKQLSCDWLLQTSWMALNKGKDFASGGFRPLVTHAAIHGIGTLAVTLVIAPSFWWLGLVDFAVHGTIDRITAVFRTKKQLKIEDRWYWWSIGIDQEAHNLTHLAYIALIYSSLSA